MCAGTSLHFEWRPKRENDYEIQVECFGSVLSRIESDGRCQPKPTPVIRRKDMTLAEAEVLALSTLKQVMEEKVRHSDRNVCTRILTSKLAI